MIIFQSYIGSFNDYKDTVLYTYCIYIISLYNTVALQSPCCVLPVILIFKV